MGLLGSPLFIPLHQFSLNLVVGYSGELSLGHAGFMCVGAFSSALFSHVTSACASVCSKIDSCIAGRCCRGCCLRCADRYPGTETSGDYLAIVTLAFGEIIKNLINILYVGVDDKGLHVATSAANLKLDQAENRSSRVLSVFPVLQPYIKILRIISS